MRIINNIKNFPGEKLALTIGFFDGLHIGHRYLLKNLCELGRKEELQTAILTFWPHPRTVFQEAYQPKLLNTFEEKNELFHTLPIDFCIQIPFTMELAQYSAFDFMRDFLKETLHVEHLIIGYDHRFGRNREAGFEDYVSHGERLSMKVSQAPVFKTENGDNVSSSFIRRLIDKGEVKEAKEYLGYFYKMSGIVEHGQKIGSSIGFPTANLRPYSTHKIVPALGVYAVKVTVNNQTYKGMACIGTRPTFESKGEPTIEVNIFNFQKDLYGKEITVEFVEFLRPQQRFSSKEALISALEEDRKKVLTLKF